MVEIVAGLAIAWLGLIIIVAVFAGLSEFITAILDGVGALPSWVSIAYVSVLVGTVVYAAFFYTPIGA